MRELALRFTAERVDRDLEDIRKARRVSTPWKTNARLMVGVGPTPYSESLIRWTRRASGRHGCPWLAVWVEGTQPLTAPEQDLLARGLGLARRLGAEVVHATGDDVAAALLEVARERNVSQIIVGKAEPPLALEAHPGGPDHRRQRRHRRVRGAPGDRPPVQPPGTAGGASLAATRPLREYGMVAWRSSPC